MAVGTAGDVQYLSCVPPIPGALAFGVSCSPKPADKRRCADDALCVPRGGAQFCSSMCRTDGDCPSGALCVDDYASAALPNGSTARLAFCTPRTFVSGTSCSTDKTCKATEACLPLGTRSALLTCQPAIGTKSAGEACAAAAECRSGECFDRDQLPPTGNNRTYCAGFCKKNSDCAANQLCLRTVRTNNMTQDVPGDDVVFGLCTPLVAPPLTGACQTDGDCLAATGVAEKGGDTCDTTLGTCYSKASRIGGPCQGRAGCPLGAYCRLNDPRFPAGACLKPGCGMSRPRP